MFDTDMFIECVHANPPLWDKALQEYSDRNEREKCWVTIAQTMFSDWSENDVKGKNLKVQDLKNKWRHIRDNFTKFINGSKSGDPAPSKKKKYVYAEALTFLLNSMQKRPTSGSIENIRNEDLQESEEVDNVPNIAEEVQATTAPAVGLESASRKSKKISPFQSQLLTQLSLSTKAEEDPDRLYILSLLGDYKKLTEDEKLDFKFANLQFFRNLRQQKNLSNVPHGQPQTQTWSQPAVSMDNPSQHQQPSFFSLGVAGPSRTTATPPYSTTSFSPCDSVYSSDY